jgi:von Willebrand factor type A domain/Aerotolerance regulator N-terminal
VAFLSPWFLLAALAAAIPILLHLFKRDEAPRVRFPTVRFIRRTMVTRRARRRPQDWLLLLLRVGALVLLALAFARPFWRAEAVTVPTTVVALDTSFSMGAPGRFDRARARAREALSAAPVGSQVALITFDDRANTVVEPVTDRAAAIAALDRLSPGARGTRYRSAIDRAAALLEDRTGRVVVVTDLQAHGWSDGVATVPAGVHVDVVDVGGPLENLAVTSVERTPQGTVTTIANGGTRARSARVRLRVPGRPVVAQPVTLAPGATAMARFDGGLPSSGVVTVTVDDAVGLPADNERFLLLDRPPPPRVLAITGGEDGDGSVFYLSRALEAVADGGDSGLEIADARGASGLSSSSLGSYDVVMLLGTAGVDRRLSGLLSEHVAGGGGLFVAAGPQLDAGLASSLLQPVGVGLKAAPPTVAFPTRLSPSDLRHPILEAFKASAGSLTGARIDRALRIETRGPVRTVAQFTNGLPALVELMPGGKGRVLVFATDVNQQWNDLPLEPGFVPLVHQVARYLARADGGSNDRRIGDLSADLVPRPGVWPVGLRGRRVAVNVDVVEASNERVTRAAFLGRVRQEGAASAGLAAASDRRDESAQAFWRWVLVAVAVLLGIELLAGRRRSTETSSVAHTS